MMEKMHKMNEFVHNTILTGMVLDTFIKLNDYIEVVVNFFK